MTCQPAFFAAIDGAAAVLAVGGWPFGWGARTGSGVPADNRGPSGSANQNAAATPPTTARTTATSTTTSQRRRLGGLPGGPPRYTPSPVYRPVNPDGGKAPGWPNPPGGG